ncbi:MAG TPA: SIS domain-containing protein [Acidimicrobiales bacterium]|nr:SIS domain-containing protein [Acidimicrobiales bacterium]
MCGIVAVLARPSSRPVPDGAVVERLLDKAREALTRGDLSSGGRLLREVDVTLAGEPGARALITDPALAESVTAAVAAITGELQAVDQTGDDLEARNQAMTEIRDHLWAIEHDRVREARQVALLAGDSNDGPAAVRAYRSIEIVLAGIDRLEVRGRDSAGVHVLVAEHGLDLEDPDVAAAIAAREADQLFTSGALRVGSDRSWLAFVYKAAAEVGELGDNVAAIRAAITDDRLLRRALRGETARATVLGHTRWASVGIISEPNAHPVESAEVDAPGLPYVVAALNGDVDNHEALVAGHDLDFPAEIGTDAKVIPTLVARGMATGADTATSFRDAVSRFEGSVAIAAGSADDPDRLLLALRGSGQALYVGLAEDAWVVASEPYGIVEQTPNFVRLDGEKPGPSGVPGQVVVLERSSGGELAGMRRLSYDGSELPLGDSDVRTADMTTRDIDRRGFSHFLLKEMIESPESMRKTLRGRVVTNANGQREVFLSQTAFPDAIRERIRNGRIDRVVVVGQGTAAMAGRALAAALRRWAPSLQVAAVAATELSGFGMSDDMASTLVVAVSQSGTTADTNRAVDLVRSRGASVVSIVNRRGSDLVAKSDAVLFTSDGRDIEMAVPSTKAFYMQVAAGQLLALAIGTELGSIRATEADELLAGLEDLPAAMETVLGRRDIAAAAAALSLPKRFWGVVGNDDNRIAAEEIRIKLSELAYRSVSCDATEDKKHIDLSCEPLILLCAAGLEGPNADDAAKEVAIFKAHKATPIVIATEGPDAELFKASASAVLEVPRVHPDLAFVLSALAGHLWGYEAVLAIDSLARELRAVRSVVDDALSAGGMGLESLDAVGQELAPGADLFFRRLRSGEYDGNLEAGLAVRLASLLRYALGTIPLDAYELEQGRLGSPVAVLTDLAEVLSEAIEQLRRPIDAIRHQAKTVTVGTSRSEEALFSAPLVAAVLGTGISREGVGYRALKSLAALDPAVSSVSGWTRYGIEGSLDDDSARLDIIDRGGVSRDIPSRTDRDPALRGTKHRAVGEREVTVAKGRRDGRTFVLVPETKNGEPVGLSLVFVELRDHLGADELVSVLKGYRDRWSALVDAVTETEPNLDLDRLAEIPVVDVLTEPVNILAERFRN